MSLPFLHRETPTVVRVLHPSIDIRLFANESVSVEADAFEQLFEFTDVARAIEDVRALEVHGDVPFFGDAEVAIERIVLTPDFHRGYGIPVGTVIRAKNIVIPKAIGNDVCCGMRLLTTDLPAEALEPHWVEIQKRLRAIFFQGERDIPMSPRQREATLRYGLPGLVETCADNQHRGVWQRFDPTAQAADLRRAHGQGSLPTRRLFGFESFIRSSGNVDGRDPQIGCVGGGNHFVEIQRIDALFDGHAARAWGLSRGNVALMVHSGSVGIGHAIGGHFMDRARQIFPTEVRAPTGGFHPLPVGGPRQEEGLFYLDGMGNAGNFAFANRLFLGMMAVRAIEEATGRSVEARLVYDAPHNLVFRDGETCLHRKGATPAHGPVLADAPESLHALAHDDSGWLGKPVIIPGSMGAPSYLLAGEGNDEALSSACHGAGRSLSRGKASHVPREQYLREIERLRIVTPIDPKSPALRLRRDILDRYEKRVMEEAPYAYKPIEPVIDSVHDGNVARRVARLCPLCTVKG
jgi:tRNA-splicing ligase RtcB